MLMPRTITPEIEAYWRAVNADLLRRSEAEAVCGDILLMFDTGEDVEGAAEFITGQRWLARTEAA